MMGITKYSVHFRQEVHHFKQTYKNQIRKYEISLYVCEFLFVVFEYSITLCLKCHLDQTI